ncbi:hypothetical protein J6590_011371 [Homalodisca vitripennis]|nr:hypothetical protein J6590_011371 [Homalodisca vitripennis]
MAVFHSWTQNASSGQYGLLRDYCPCPPYILGIGPLSSCNMESPLVAPASPRPLGIVPDCMADASVERMGDVNEPVQKP